MKLGSIVGTAAPPIETLFPGWRGKEPIAPHLAHVSNKLHAETPELAEAIESLPFARFESCQPHLPVQRYTEVPQTAAALVAALPEAVRAPWLCALLLWHIGRFDTAFAASGLHEEFAGHYIDGFHRILDQIEKDPGFADLSRDSFLKDLWIARVVMIPAFAQIWWPRSGISARTVLQAGPRAIAYVLLGCGGRRPLLEGHTHDPMARAYWNAQGWAEALRLAALALPALPHVRGAFGTAWFYDPAVLEISPRIRFAQDLQVGQGAIRMKVGTNPAAVANATATSAERRNRYRDGSYLPTDYAILWSRRRLIRRYGR